MEIGASLHAGWRRELDQSAWQRCWLIRCRHAAQMVSITSDQAVTDDADARGLGMAA
jgi:transposase-like protein